MFELDRVDAKLGDKDGSTIRIEALGASTIPEIDRLELFRHRARPQRRPLRHDAESALVDMRVSRVTSGTPSRSPFRAALVEAQASKCEPESRVTFADPSIPRSEGSIPETPSACRREASQ